MKIKLNKKVDADAKILCLHIKVVDNFCCTVCDQDRTELVGYDGYVPHFMPGEHFGDYVLLDIDIDTGKILNWKVPSVKTMEDFINGTE